MMITKNKLGVVFVTFAGLTGSVCADSQWYINPMLGYQVNDSERALEDDPLYGIGLEYQFNDTWSSELKYLQSTFDSDSVKGVEADYSHIQLEVMYGLQALATDKIKPYLGGGVGHAEYDYDDFGKQDGTSLSFGPGLRYWFSDSWSSKIDLRWLYGVDESENDGLLTVALSYAFGKHSSAAAPVVMAAGDADNDGVMDADDRCPNTPAGASVDALGCELDSDGDGVVDSMDQCPETTAGAKVDSVGCAEKLTHTESIDLKVTFATGSTALTNNSMLELDKVAQFMRSYPSVTGVIEGHTDNTGDAAFNQQLSQQRADAVRDELVEKFGIDGTRLSAKGYGEGSPIATNDTAAGRQANRRVTAVFEAEVVE